MSTRREDDSRPSGNATSQRNTARDVPAAKFKDGSVGTVAPRGLRGPALLPGQGAPERIVPEEVELAVVLRDAETLDGPHVARVAARRLPDPRSPSPTPVSVEVPRVRSNPPLDEYVSTPPSPSARSIQSGTLMSIGSIDPRAPTELSLPSPRPLSVSERAQYWGPGAVVDRTPVQAPRELPGVIESSRFRDVTQRPGGPISEPLPHSSPRSVPLGSGAISSARPSLKADSEAPPARHFARVPHSYSPVSPSSVHTAASPVPRSVAPRSARSGSPSTPDGAPQFQIHSELEALPHEFHDDAFDLRSASTQREPLAGRKPAESADWTAHGPAEGAAQRESDAGVRSSRHSSSAVTLLVDRGRATPPPSSERAPTPQRASVPLSWVLGAAAFALLLAIIVAWVLRPPGAPVVEHAVAGRPSAAAPGAATLPAVRETPPALAPQNLEARSGTSAAPMTSAPRVLQRGTPARSAASAAAQSAPAAAEPSAPGDAAAKGRQSIY